MVELLMVTAVMGVLIGAALPSLGSITNSMRLTSQANLYLSALHLTRSEAIKRNSRMTLCKSADGASCSQQGGWQQGWIIFHDADNDGAKDIGETVVHQAAALPSGYQLVGNLNVAKYVSFSSTGSTKLVSGAFQAGTLTLCRESVAGGEGRQIVINSVGRPRIQKVAVNACV